MTLIKKLLVLAFFLIVGFLFFTKSESVSAQGTFSCFFAAPQGIKECNFKESKCQNEYKPAACELFKDNKSSCEASHQCISETTANNCKYKIVVLCPADYPVDCNRGSQCCKTQDFCNLLPNPIPAAPAVDIHGKCKGDNDIDTALGCIPAGDLNDFVGWILGKLIFVASGIAFLLMAFGALQILTSAGSPEKVKAGSELITSALSGLLFIILALFLLKLIGVDILHIPGFGS